jgi:hypothetical protein
VALCQALISGGSLHDDVAAQPAGTAKSARKASQSRGVVSDQVPCS